MNFELILLGASIHALIWEHLPHWGTWFNRLLAWLPQPLRTLYEQWRCPYCAGFWIALVLHAVTGHWTFPIFADLAGYWGALALPLGWVLDALATALGIKISIMTISALAFPAIHGMRLKEEVFGAKPVED